MRHKRCPECGTPLRYGGRGEVRDESGKKTIVVQFVNEWYCPNEDCGALWHDVVTTWTEDRQGRVLHREMEGEA